MDGECDIGSLWADDGGEGAKYFIHFANRVSGQKALYYEQSALSKRNRNRHFVASLLSLRSLRR